MVPTALPRTRRKFPFDSSREDEDLINYLICMQIVTNGDPQDKTRRTAHNLELPVSRIPQEVLEAIFFQLLESIRISSPRGTANPGSFNFLFVCRRWYEVSMNTQTLVLLG